MRNFSIAWDIEFDKDKEYRWVTEKGENTCEECKRLNGKVFKGDEVPLRPHPNCKCEVEEVIHAKDGKIKANISMSENYYQIETEELTLKEDKKENSKYHLLKDNEKAVLNSNSNINVKHTNNANDITNKNGATKSKQINNDIQLINANKKIEELNQRLNNPPKKTQTQSTKEENKNTEEEKYKKLLEEFKRFGIIDSKEKFAIDYINYLKKNNSLIQMLLENYYDGIKNKETLTSLDKTSFDAGVWGYSLSHNWSESQNLWDIASSKFESKNSKKYIEKNGRLINRVSDLKDKNLELFIRDKLDSQINIREARGIIFHENSTIARKLKKDDNFQQKIKEIITENNNSNNNFKNKISQNDQSTFIRHFQHSSLNEFSNPDLNNSLGKIDINDIYIDNEKNIRLKVIDTYDFNKNDDRTIVKIGRKFQEQGLIENYYTITEIKIPFKEWSNYFGKIKY